MCIEDKYLNSTLKGFGFNTILGIEEVDLLFVSTVVQFTNLKGATPTPVLGGMSSLANVLYSCPNLFSTIAASRTCSCFLSAQSKRR